MALVFVSRGRRLMLSVTESLLYIPRHVDLETSTKVANGIPNNISQDNCCRVILELLLETVWVVVVDAVGEAGPVVV